MKKLISLMAVIFTLSILTPTAVFSEEQSKFKKFWIWMTQGVKDTGKEIKSDVKEAGKEIKEGAQDAGQQIGDKTKEEVEAGKDKVKKDINDAKKEFGN